jgi:hypothetical protein
MVSLSNFNLQMLQIVALRSQTVAGFRANPKLLQTVNRLLQSVAEPQKTGVMVSPSSVWGCPATRR